MIIITDKEIKELAKELCFYSPFPVKCNSNCDKCNGYGSWKKNRIAVIKVISLWEKMKKQNIDIEGG